MKNLTTPKAILFGFGLIAIAIASLPYSSQIIKPAFATEKILKVQICSPAIPQMYIKEVCATVSPDGFKGFLHVEKKD